MNQQLLVHILVDKQKLRFQKLILSFMINLLTNEFLYEYYGTWFYIFISLYGEVKWIT